MEKEAEQIIAIFLSNGWKEIPLSEEMKQAGLTGIYLCEYAAVGIVCVPGVAGIKACWANCQVYMSDLRDMENIGDQKDLYLVFIVQEIDMDIDMSILSDLQSIINDTYVCRKICIELKQHEGSLEKALMDTPFFKDMSKERQKDSQTPFADPGLMQNEIPSQLLDDLGRRSASVVLDRLLAGDYEDKPK